jgi:putative two-component system response regulator
MLEQKVRERTADLEATQLEILERLALAAEYRDDDTGQHTRRVGHMSAQIARVLGLPDSEVTLIQRAAPLHDVGKIAIADAILLKPGKLTPVEFEQMKTHTTRGAQMLGGGRFPLLQRAEEIALTHHERWDGTGHIGLRGETIPLSGRIVTVADVFDALTNERPYKKAWSRVDAIAEIVAQSGRQFDPAVVEAFLQVVGQCV